MRGTSHIARLVFRQPPVNGGVMTSPVLIVFAKSDILEKEPDTLLFKATGKAYQNIASP